MAEVASAYVSILPSARGFGSKLDGQIGGDLKKSGSKLGKVFGAAVAGGALAGGALTAKFTKDAAILDTKMREVVTLFGETGKAAEKSLGQIQGQVKDLSNEFGIAQETLTGGLYQAISAGVPRDNAFEFMQVASKASIAGVTDVETAVDGITTTINAFGLEAKDAQAISDSMFAAVKGGKTTFGELSSSLFNIAPAAAAAGVEFTEINAAIATLTAGGTPTSVATNQMRAALDGLQKPSAALTSIFKELGYENAQVAIESEGLGFALDAVKDASKGNNGELQKLLGSSEAVAAANVLAGTGAEKFTAELKNQAGAAGATSAAFDVVNAGAARQFEILKENLVNLGLTIGQKVLPHVSTVVTYLNANLIPAIERVGARFSATANFINRNKVAIGALATVIGTAIVVTKVHTAALAVQAAGGLLPLLKATKLVTAATKTYAAVQWVLNAALTANPIGLVIVALVALGAGLVVAYRKSETFRKVVDGAFDSVKAGAQSLANFVTKTIPDAFNTVVTFVKGIPAKIAAIFTGAASIFYSAGSQLMSQLAAGIADKIGDAIAAAQAGLSRLRGLLPGSPIKWGPLKNWNNGGAGKRLMGLVAEGIEKGTPKAVEAAKGAFAKISDSLKSTRDELSSTLDGLKNDFASLANSISSAFTGDLFGVSAVDAVSSAWGGITTMGKTVGQSFIDNLTSKKAELTGLLSSFRTLQGWGLDPAFLSQMFASGNGALIAELAGMGQTGATSAASLFGEVNSLGAQLGTSVAQNDPVASRIDTTNKNLEKVIRQLDFLAGDIGKELNNASRKGHRDKKNGK